MEKNAFIEMLRKVVNDYDGKQTKSDETDENILKIEKQTEETKKEQTEETKKEQTEETKKEDNSKSSIVNNFNITYSENEKEKSDDEIEKIKNKFDLFCNVKKTK